MDKAIYKFYNLVNINKIARQLNKTPATKALTLSTVKFEIQERATITKILFQLFKNNKARIKFIYTLAQLYYQQKTCQPKALKQKKTDFIIFKSSNISFATK